MIDPQNEGTSNPDPQHLERESDEIRDDMNRTLEALERRLSPGRLLDQCTQFVREHGSEVAHEISSTVRQHPVPIIMTGVGVAWLIASLARSSRSGDAYASDIYGRDEYDEPRDYDEPRRSEYFSDTTNERGIRSRVRARAHAAQDKMRGAMHSAQDRAQRVRNNFGDMVSNQPLAFGALAVAVGAIVGAAIPLTETEREAMRPVSDRALAKAEEIGNRTYDKVRGAFSGSDQGSPSQGSQGSLSGQEPMSGQERMS